MEIVFEFASPIVGVIISEESDLMSVIVGLISNTSLKVKSKVLLEVPSFLNNLLLILFNFNVWIGILETNFLYSWLLLSHCLSLNSISTKDSSFKGEVNVYLTIVSVIFSAFVDSEELIRIWWIKFSSSIDLYLINIALRVWLRIIGSSKWNKKLCS